MNSTFSKLLLLAIISITLLSCKKEEPTPQPSELTAEEKAIEILTDKGSITWESANGGSVEKDGVNVSQLFEGFELNLKSGTSQNYTIKNGNDVFDQSGGWTFAGSNFDKCVLAGTRPACGKEISFTRTSNNLRLTFSIANPSARVNGTQVLAGTYIFNLIKKN
jgi:hypothetical protein